MIENKDINNMTELQLTPCNLNAFAYSTYDFFCDIKETNRFIIAYYFYEYKDNLHYGILETHKNAMGSGICTVGDTFLYRLGEQCTVCGYCPIKITINKE